MVTKEEFGRTAEGRLVERYRIVGAGGMETAVLTLGGRLQQLLVPNQNGELQNVVLGYDSVKEYERDTFFLGACIGRNSNRIAGGSYEWKGETFRLEQNEGENNHHSGSAGYQNRIWEAEAGEQEVTLRLTDEDGSGGFPGTLRVSVTYRVTDDNTLELTYRALGDRDTPVNMTNHSYFNFAGRDSHIFDHELQIFADDITQIREGSIPTGRLLPLEGTIFDFRRPKMIGRDAFRFEELQLALTGGYDHNFVTRGAGYRRVARACCSRSGIGMEVFTDQPGVQFYAGNFLKAPLVRHGGFCLETQHFPDSVHHNNFPSVMLEAGSEYRTKTGYHFFVVE